MSLYEELENIGAGEARQAVGTVFAFADSDETDNSAFLATLSSNVFEVPAVGEFYRAMVDGITTTEELSDDEKESAKIAVAITLTSLSILAKAKHTS